MSVAFISALGGGGILLLLHFSTAVAQRPATKPYPRSHAWDHRKEIKIEWLRPVPICPSGGRLNPPTLIVSPFGGGERALSTNKSLSVRTRIFPIIWIRPRDTSHRPLFFVARQQSHIFFIRNSGVCVPALCSSLSLFSWCALINACRCGVWVLLVQVCTDIVFNKYYRNIRPQKLQKLLT